MTWNYTRAENGNVALAGEVDLQISNGSFVLAVGFGRNSAESGHRALASLLDGFETARVHYVRAWQDWQKSLSPLDSTGPGLGSLYRISTALLRAHEAKRFPGGIIASLSIPWGFAKGDDDLGGYHLVWPRDLVEVAGGFLAAGAKDEACRVLHYLRLTQEMDGHWPQNMWLDGTPYWLGIQMDETAFPILLVDLARRENALQADDLKCFWPMVFRAAGFIARNGPVTQQDRWEEDPGYSPFTLAVEISALLAAADLADLNGETAIARYLRETADIWNVGIERWTYVTETDLARQIGVEGYYIRIAPPDVCEAASPTQGYVAIKNRSPDQSTAPATHIVGTDALALVRFGLRSANDPRIINTVRVIDALLKVETPYGPVWHRYNDDGYGEHEDGRPFDGTGIGRAWPLLTGERAHYELAAGQRRAAQKLLHALEAFANESGMIPEQIWNMPDIAGRELFFGRPSGSAMPLVWAHAEYIKLLRSLSDNRIFDQPPQPIERYQVKNIISSRFIWRFNHRSSRIPTGRVLRVETLAPAIVHWTVDDWHTVTDTGTSHTGLGIHFVDLPTDTLPAGTRVIFTFFWLEVNRWERLDFTVAIESKGTAG